MQRICVIGSINIDIVFKVASIVRPGETIASESAARFLGGKGQNQAVALRKAWPEVLLAGNIGASDSWILDGIAAAGVRTDFVRRLEGQATGSAFIQVDAKGQNCIVLDKGANHRFTKESVDAVLSALSPGDLVVLQNEINLLAYIMEESKKRGIRTAFNPSPFDATIADLPLDGLDFLVLNEVEGEGFSGETDPGQILAALGKRCPETTVVLTLGAGGAMCSRRGETAHVAGRLVKAVDTTAAGDTFTGFFLAGVLGGLSAQKALERANIAASISVTRPGAAVSIPSAEEVDAVAAGN
jgi:ribokinase